MTVEQRLVAALRAADHVEPSTDLWSRVVHSIEEDRAHRRRVWTATAISAATLAALTIVGVLGLTDGPTGRFVRPAVMEFIETVALVVLVAVLGPAIRRFGRGYATDLWPATPAMATALVRLLDVAYVLVFAGFILMTAELDFGATAQLRSECFLGAVDCHTVGAQVQSAAQRIGGLILVMGILHAVTISVLPVVALVSSSTRLGRPLPKWLVVVLAIAGVGVGFLLLSGLVGALVGLAGA
jgi:hypothetical protein